MRSLQRTGKPSWPPSRLRKGENPINIDIVANACDKNEYKKLKYFSSPAFLEKTIEDYIEFFKVKMGVNGALHPISRMLLVVNLEKLKTEYESTNKKEELKRTELNIRLKALSKILKNPEEYIQKYGKD